MDSKTYTFAENAIRVGKFDDQVISVLRLIITHARKMEGRNAIYRRILEACNIDDTWENAEGEPLKPLFDLLDLER